MNDQNAPFNAAAGDDLQDSSRKVSTERDYIEGNKIVNLYSSPLPANLVDQNIMLAVPSPPSLLVGRDRLLNAVRTALHNGQNVSLHGLGGIGKTSLAAILATEYQENGKKVFWSRVGHLHIDDLLTEIGRQLGDQTLPGVNSERKIQRIRGLLHSFAIHLIVLDDVWNAATARSFAREVLPSGCTLLVNGRKRTGVGTPFDVEHLDENDSTKLFNYHAKNENNDNVVVAVCKMLQGHPMAIEIAGKLCWIRGFSPLEFKNRLEKANTKVQALALSDDAHENMWGTLQTSYDMLSNNEQKVFRAFGSLWVAAAGMELVSKISGLTEDETLDSLGNLVANSLIKPELTIDGLRIYRLHDLAYDYARAAMDKMGDPINNRSAAVYCAEYANTYAHQERTAHNHLEAERDNLLGATRWAANNKEWKLVNSLALDLCDRSEFLRWRGYDSEAINVLTLGVDAAKELSSPQDQGTHLTNLGIAYRQMGQFDKSIKCHEESIVIMRLLNDRQGESDSLGEIGWALSTLGKMEDSIKFLTQAYEITKDIGNRRWEAIWLGTLGRVYTFVGRLTEAVNAHQKALDIMLSIEDQRGEGARLGELGWDYLAMGEFDKSSEYFHRALEIAKRIGDRRREGTWIAYLGVSLLEQGNLSEGKQKLDEAISIVRSNGDHITEAEIICSLARISLLRAELDNAEMLVRQALTINSHLGHKRGIGNCHYLLAQIYVERAKQTTGFGVVKLVNQAKAAFETSLQIRELLNDPRAKLTKVELEQLMAQIS